MGKLSELILSNNSDYVKEYHHLVSTGLHAEKYYFFKKFLEDASNADIVVNQLSEKILEYAVDDGNVTLLGYSPYSNLIISKTVARLNSVSKTDKFNYAITSNFENKDFPFQSTPKFNDKIIIVFPVSITFNAYFNLRMNVKKWLETNGYPQTKIDNHLFSVFLISNNDLRAEDESQINMKQYCSIDTSKQIATLINTVEIENHYCHYLDILMSELYAEESCPLCFAAPQNALTSEQYLFPINSITKTPRLIFDNEDIEYDIIGFESASDKNKRKFNDLFKIDHDRPSAHLFGHLNMSNTNYLHYIKIDVFYDNNGEQIIQHFIKEIQERIKGKKEVVVITCNRENSSNCLEELIKRGGFGKLPISVVNYKPFKEHPRNFAIYKDMLKKSAHKLIVYYADVLAAGDELRELDLFLGEIQPLKRYSLSNFNFVLSIIDRTDNINKTRILKSTRLNTKDIVSFFKLNVPLISLTYLGNPLDERREKLIHTFNGSHLDGLRLNILKQIHGIEPKNINKITTQKWYNPTTDPLFTKEHENLIKLYVYHTLNEHRRLENWILNETNINSDKISELAGDFFDANNIKKSETTNKIVSDLLIKTLSRPPFSYHMNIYRLMFNYNIFNLERLIEEIKIVGEEISFLTYRELKFYIRRTVELNSNAIISFQFISMAEKLIPALDTLKNKIRKQRAKLKKSISSNVDTERINPSETLSAHIIFEKRKFEKLSSEIGSIMKFKYFLLYCFKELISESNTKSIRLEHLINSLKKENAPSNIDELLMDDFFIYRRILRMENIILLQKLKEDINKNEAMLPNEVTFKELKEDKKEMWEKYLQVVPTKIYDHNHKMAIKLINNSEYKNSESNEFEELKHSISWMITISRYLNRLNEPNAKSSAQHIDEKIRLIMLAILRIFEPENENAGKKGDHLQYALFVKYHAKDGQKKIYPIFSEDESENDTDHNDNSGLVSKMLEGSMDADNVGNLHTVIPFIKQGNEISTFKRTKHFYLRVAKENKQKKSEKIYIQQEFNKDLEKFPHLSNATMLQYIRLADIELDDYDWHPDKGKAIILIYNKKQINNTLEDVREVEKFLNIEKVRLLLLVKKSFRNFLKNTIENDVFVELMNKKQFDVVKNSLSHGINNYLNTLTDLVRTDNPRYEKIAQILTDAIREQIFSSNLKPGDKVHNINKDIYYADLLPAFKELVNLICSEIRIGGKIINFQNLNNLLYIHFPEAINKTIFDVVIPEILINMKKYHPVPDDNNLNLFEIKTEKNILIFRNRCYGNIRSSKNLIIKTHGLYMCNNILQNLGYKTLEPVILNENIFELRLDLNL